jgi:hypothetical protein
LKRPKGGGKFSVVQLDQYLSEYETLDDFSQSGLITRRFMYNEFSYDHESAYKNKDVLAEVVKERKEDQDDPSIWQGFFDLGRQFDKTITANKRSIQHIVQYNVLYVCVDLEQGTNGFCGRPLKLPAGNAPFRLDFTLMYLLEVFLLYFLSVRREA